MSKRLQIRLPDSEMAEIERIAHREQITVVEWALRTLRDACSRNAGSTVQRKLRVIREAATHSLPTADIDQMFEEIERRYLD